MVDNFAKYSKLERKIISIDIQLHESKEKKGGFLTKISLNYGFKIAVWLILITCSYLYKTTPVLQLDKKLDLTPFNFLISYPHGDNYISFHFWLVCCSVVARAVKEMKSKVTFYPPPPK